MCACVCLSNLRYPERDVVSSPCLHHLEELRLARCTNCFSSRYDASFVRKSLWKFFASYAPNSLARTVTFPVSLGRMNFAHFLTFAESFPKVTS